MKNQPTGGWWFGAHLCNTLLPFKFSGTTRGRWRLCSCHCSEFQGTALVKEFKFKIPFLRCRRGWLAGGQGGAAAWRRLSGEELEKAGAVLLRFSWGARKSGFPGSSPLLDPPVLRLWALLKAALLISVGDPGSGRSWEHRLRGL